MKRILLASFNSKSLKETKWVTFIFFKFLEILFEKFNQIFVFFSGPFGSGKTTFINFLIKHFGIKESARSPSFVILKIYQGKIKNSPLEILHFDFYRIKKNKNIFDFALKQKNGKKLILGEWGEKFEKTLKKSPKINIKIDYGLKKNERLFKIYLCF